MSLFNFLKLRNRPVDEKQKSERTSEEQKKEELSKIKETIERLINDLNEEFSSSDKDNDQILKKNEILKSLKMKEIIEDLGLVFNIEKGEIENLIKKIEGGEIEVNEEENSIKAENSLSEDKNTKNILNLIRSNKALRYAVMSMALMFKISDSFGTKSTVPDKITGNQKNKIEATNLNIESDSEKTYFMDNKDAKEGPEEYIIPDPIKLDIYNKYIVDKAELTDAKQVKIDVQNFLNKINLADLQILDNGEGVDITITSGASPEKTNSWDLASFNKFISDNSISIDIADMEKFVLEAEKYTNDQKGNYWLSLARGFFLQKMIIESLQDLANQGDIKAQYLLANGNFIVENFPTSEQDFKPAKPGQDKESRIYNGSNPKFYKENGEGMTWAEIRNSLVEIETGEKRIIKNKENEEIIEKIPPTENRPNYEVISNLKTQELEKIILNYNLVIFDKSGSMKETVPNFFVNELRRENKTTEIAEIQKNMKEEKEIKNEKINIKNFGTILYAGVENIENSYNLQNNDQNNDIIEIITNLNYKGYAERQINLINQSLKNIYQLIIESEKSPEKCSTELKSIIQEKNIKLALFTDEQIKYTPENINEFKNIQKMFEDKGYTIETDLIFADKIGSRNSELIKIDMGTLLEILEYQAQKFPGKKIYNYSQTEVIKGGILMSHRLEEVGE